MWSLLVGVLFLWWFFFFSSRRRHTRCLSDWSSDVCSSDLTLGRPGRDVVSGFPLVNARSHELGHGHLGGIYIGALVLLGYEPLASLLGLRSEERRVGKECRCRWAT